MYVCLVMKLLNSLIREMSPFRAIQKRCTVVVSSLPDSVMNIPWSSISPFTSSSNSKTSIPQSYNKHLVPHNRTRISMILSDLKNQRVDEARALFDQLQFPDVYLSTKMISSYLDKSRVDDALQLFDVLPVRDVVMWNLMIKGCVNSGYLGRGLKLFDEMPERNVISWTTVMNALLKFGKVEEAQLLFDSMPLKDIAAWNAMIHGLFENRKVDEAMRLFEVMPDTNLITWTTMITGLDRCGRSDEALLFFWKMLGFGLKPSSDSFTCVITACANVGNLRVGIQVHAHVLKLGCVFDPYVIASLVTFYANCQLIEDSLKAFREKLHLNVVVWTSLLTGYGKTSDHYAALRVFSGMIRLGILPNQSSFTSALNSSCEMEAIGSGREIHCFSTKLGLETDPFVGNSLVVLYTKCGNLNEGISAFEELASKNIVSWNAIIVGCAKHGHGKWALAFFTQMLKEGINPDEITVTALLSSCSHSGMLQKGRHLFESLRQHSHIQLTLEHYTCMVDIFCRSGKLEEAENLVINMPLEANLSIWIALLSGCSAQCNLEVAERAAERVFAIESHCSAAYVMLSNMYALAGRWNDAARVRKEMNRIGTVKETGRSWVAKGGASTALF